MKKIISIMLTVVILLTLCACGQSEQEPVAGMEKNDLQNNNHEAQPDVTEATSIPDNYLPSKTKTIYVQVEYVRYDMDAPDGIPPTRALREYDELGNLKRETIYATSYAYSSSSGLSDVMDITWLNIFSYDSQGIRTGYKNYCNDVLQEEGLVECDSAGRIVVLQTTNSIKDDRVLTREYKYDNRGDMVEAWWKCDGNVYRHDEYTYTQEGKKLTYKKYESDDVIDKTWEYIYDTNGKLREIESVQYNYNDVPTRYHGEAKYNEKGELYQIIYYADEGYVYRICTFDSNENLIEDSNYDAKGVIRSKSIYTYKAIEIPAS